MKFMLMYPPGKLFQRGEDRAQCNIDDSTAVTMHACNDLGYAAAILKQKKCGVFLRDYQTEGATFEDVLSDIEEFDPDFIFLSTTNGTIDADIKFANELHKIKNDLKFIFKGSVFFNARQEHLKQLDLENIDFMMGEEVELVMPLLAEYLLGKIEVENVPGLWYKSDGVFKNTGFDNSHLANLDSVPFPARELMNNSLYVRPDTGRPMATIVAARGCPSSCVYCLAPIIFGRHVRLRSVENVFAEMEECVEKFGIYDFFFQADTFTINQQWAIALCDKIISSDLNGKVQFTINARTDTVTAELLQKLKEAGCFTIAVGFESGSDETLKKVKKGTTVEKNLRCAKLLKEAGIQFYGFFMLGFPWETKKDFRKTLNHALKLDPDFIEIHVALPYYSTELYNMCAEYGTLSGDSWNHDLYTPNTTGTKTVPLKKVLSFKKYFLLRFYSRPSYLFRLFKNKVTDFTTFKNYLKYGFRLLKNLLFKSRNR
ncbi:MAG: radical SAM protein [Clostridia bacterium]|nr:radical SAM protein [Clostridia bacterium]